MTLCGQQECIEIYVDALTVGQVVTQRNKRESGIVQEATVQRAYVNNHPKKACTATTRTQLLQPLPHVHCAKQIWPTQHPSNVTSRRKSAKH